MKSIETISDDCTDELAELTLTVERGPLAGSRIRLNRVTDDWIFGGRKLEHGAICFRDPSVSRRHFQVRFEEEGLRLRALDSTNGTYIHSYNECLLPGQDYLLSEGSTFLIGSVAITIKDFVFKSKLMITRVL